MASKGDEKVNEGEKPNFSEQELKIQKDEEMKEKRRENARKARETRLNFLETHPELRKSRKKKTISEREKELNKKAEMNSQSGNSDEITELKNNSQHCVEDINDKFIIYKDGGKKKKNKIDKEYVDLLVENKVLKELERIKVEKKQKKALKKQSAHNEIILGEIQSLKEIKTAPTEQKQAIKPSIRYGISPDIFSRGHRHI